MSANTNEQPKSLDATPVRVSSPVVVRLCDLKPGEHGYVAAIAPGSARTRLMELGLTPGTRVEVVRYGQKGCPVDVKVRGYRLSVRRAEARQIRVSSEPAGRLLTPQRRGCLRPNGSGHIPDRPAVFALVGNPNCGKTTLFNALTGLRQKVGNYPGVTVEHKTGRVRAGSREITIVDIPGLYGMNPQSPDEAVARDVLLGRVDEIPRPEAILNVVDANNLERNLLLTSQLMDLGLPMVVVLTMNDLAQQNGITVNPQALQNALGIPVIAVNADNRREGLAQARSALLGYGLACPVARTWTLDPKSEAALTTVHEAVCVNAHKSPSTGFAEAVMRLSNPGEGPCPICQEDFRDAVQSATDSLREAGTDFASAVTEARYRWVHSVVRAAVEHKHTRVAFGAERVDKLLMHPVLGYLVFLSVMALVFQTIFAWAAWPMDMIGHGVDRFAHFLSRSLPAGDLSDLLVNGVVGGVGTTLTFLPQILLLFLFIGLLEDTGYMARAAFLMDRFMNRVGLHGRSFIPLLSSFACAIPGIMAARTIDNRKARLVTILVAPLISCSARLPVYSLMIAATIPAVKVWGGVNLQGVTLLSMYLLGGIAAFGMAWIFRHTLLRGEQNTFIMELPPYRVPHWSSILLQMVERAWLFAQKAGTVILAMSVVMWFLSTYPKSPGLEKPQQVERSYVGRAGKVLEPLISPLGFDWRIGVGLISSFAAREVFVATMATIYNVEDSGVDNAVTLQTKLRNARLENGRKAFTPLLGICVMVYYVLAMQCISTIAVVRRETNGWKWPIFQVAYMTALAWIVTFAIRQFGIAMGWS